MPITQVDLANEALDLVGAATIVSLNDPTPEAGIVARALGPTMSRVLQSYPWACVTTAMDLNTAVVTHPDNSLSAFALPDDYLRVVEAQSKCWRIETLGGLPHIVVQGEQVASVYIRYIIDQTDPDQLTPLLRELIAYELAIKVAAKLTESPQRIAALTRKAIQVRKLAQASDARERTAPNLDSGDGNANMTWADAFGAGG